MTREKAIERLKTDIYKYSDFKENLNENEFWMAFDMAIKALEQEPKDCGYQQAKNDLAVDCISRKQAIDAFPDLLPNMGYNKKAITEILQEVPSITPQEPCEDEYIKVPKKALKYRTAGMVAYNAEWLKNHFDIERAVIYGEQQPCTDAISRQAVKEQMVKYGFSAPDMTVTEFVENLPPAMLYSPDKWIPVSSERTPEEGETVIASTEYGVFPETRFCEKYGWEWAYEAGADYWAPLEGVQAWMPLPTSYQGEER